MALVVTLCQSSPKVAQCEGRQQPPYAIIEAVNFPRNALLLLAQYISEPPEMISHGEESKKVKTTKGN
jgi:hypothetical protein